MLLVQHPLYSEVYVRLILAITNTLQNISTSFLSKEVECSPSSKHRYALCLISLVPSPEYILHKELHLCVSYYNQRTHNYILYIAHIACYRLHKETAVIYTAMILIVLLLVTAKNKNWKGLRINVLLVGK